MRQDESMPPYDFGLIVPCYNYAAGLPHALERIAGWKEDRGLRFLLCIVDDGSSDGSQEIAARFQAAHPGWCRLVRLPVNKGKGNAIRRGTDLIAREAPFLLFTDCDLYYGLSVIEDRVLPALQAGADIVILDRSWKRQFHASSMLRKFLSYSFNHLKTILTGVTFEDSQAGLKGFRSDFLRAVLPVARINGFAFDVELLSVALQYRFRVERIPIERQIARGADKTTITARKAARMLWDLLRIARARYSGLYSSAYFSERIRAQVYQVREENGETRA